VYDIIDHTNEKFNTEGDINDLSIQGNTVVWIDRSGGKAGDLVTYDFARQVMVRLPETWSYVIEPSIWGSLVVWVDNRNRDQDIYGYNLKTRTEFPICTSPGDQNSPAIDGDKVVWVDQRDGYNNPVIHGARIIDYVN
jgi:beta propeller repeat protein